MTFQIKIFGTFHIQEYKKIRPSSTEPGTPIDIELIFGNVAIRPSICLDNTFTPVSISILEVLPCSFTSPKQLKIV